jgi:hypothetical protein
MRSLMICILTKYCSVEKNEKNGMGGTCSTCRRDESCIQVLVGKPEGNISLGRPRHKLEDNINMDLREVGCGDMDWIDLTEERTGGGHLCMR